MNSKKKASELSFPVAAADMTDVYFKPGPWALFGKHAYDETDVDEAWDIVQDTIAYRENQLDRIGVALSKNDVGAAEAILRETPKYLQQKMDAAAAKWNGV